jgi:hypothetical protein
MGHRRRQPREVNPLAPVLLIGMMGAVVLATAYGLGRKAASPGVELAADVLPPPGADSDQFDYRVVAHWNNWPVTYAFVNCPGSLDCGTAHSVVRDALATWAAVGGLQFQEVESGAQIQIAWVRGEHGDQSPFDGRGGTVAHATPPYQSGAHPLDGDIHFDDDEVWVVGIPTAGFPAEVHLPTIALHEIGHAIGLDHSELPDALMWETYMGIRNITADDLAAVQALYGANVLTDAVVEAPPPAPPEPTEPPEPPGPPIPADSDVAATPTVLLRLRSGPSTGYRTLALVPAGTTHPVIGRNEDLSWVQVSVDGQVGWMAAWLCQVRGDPASLPVAQP